jgi:flagellar secretion chaperone FliS
MHFLNPWKSYRQIATQTAPPGQLVLMLYEGAIRFLERARAGFTHEDPAEFNQAISNNILRAQEIIGELNLSLNMSAGGQLAHTLRRLYEYMDWRLTEANMRKEQGSIEEVIGRLAVLRDAWATLLANQGQAPVLVAAPPAFAPAEHLAAA